MDREVWVTVRICTVDVLSGHELPEREPSVRPPCLEGGQINVFSNFISHIHVYKELSSKEVYYLSRMINLTL